MGVVHPDRLIHPFELFGCKDMTYETLPSLHQVGTSEIEHFLVHSGDLCVAVVSPLTNLHI